MEKVRVRFAPSPTGYLHIGGLRTAFFNWLWARKNGGEFILRIEDTDKERYVEGAVENIQEALVWYGLDIDQGPIFQSDRTEIYKEKVKQLVKQDKAYYCFCTQERLDEVRKIQKANKQATKYDGFCRSLSDEEVQNKIKAGEKYVIRLKVPHQSSTIFQDKIYGRVEVENKNIDDQVLLKSDGYPTYHLANVVDDFEMGITHVIRAEEWLPSTPKHIMLYQAFGWVPPEFAHLPMVLGSDRSKLSKRHGAVAALEYKKMGYLPEAILNFIALLGWNPKTNEEVFTRKQLITEFDLAKVNKSSAIFNIEKLDWLNGHYIRTMEIEKLADMAKEFLVDIPVDDRFIGALALARERVKSLHELNEAMKFIYQLGNYNPEILVHKKDNARKVSAVFTSVSDFVEKIEASDFQPDNLREKFKEFIEKEGFNNRVVLWPLRVAVTGLEKSPDVFDVMAVLGKEESLKRIGIAENYLQNM